MVKLSEIAALLNVPLDAADRDIARVASIDEAGPDDLTYITGDRYLDRLAASKAGAVVAPAKLALPELPNTVVFRAVDPELAIAAILARLAPTPVRPLPGIHPTAVIEASASIGVDAAIGPNVYVAEHAHVGRGTVLHANVVVGGNARVGNDCELHPGAVLYQGVQLGDRVIVHANAVIGADGFGYRWDGKRHAKVPQIGVVVIGDDVEIGAATCIDRAKFGQTRIGPGTKIDNLVQVGHNTVTGAHCILCGQVGLAGSTTLGNGVVMGGNAATAGHLKIGDGTMLAARAAVASDTKAKEVLAGAPAIPHRQWLRQEAAIRALPELLKRVRALESELGRLKGSAS
jgi:UDP-3-O-[3-hydroxymyristoyl] glucosamine N-acyltransferase